MDTFFCLIGVAIISEHYDTLQVAIESLRRENHRLLHFPPIFLGSKVTMAMCHVTLGCDL